MWGGKRGRRAHIPSYIIFQVKKEEGAYQRKEGKGGRTSDYSRWREKKRLYGGRPYNTMSEIRGSRTTKRNRRGFQLKEGKSSKTTNFLGEREEGQARQNRKV